jgi:2-C-methyl-D-erythritol 4-phosphate cytidylyltransferase / 2-C-methyl-D-erythritol 2,4-cyclodiphosphate synthase
MGELVAVLVAAGRSRRMGGDKLWIDLWGRPAWRWSLDLLLAVPGLSQVAVVVPPNATDRFRSRLPPSGSGRCLVVPGGAARPDSVRAGLRALHDGGVGRDAMVLVHDAARPAVDLALVERVVEAARDGGAAIPVQPVADTLKTVREGAVHATVSRQGLGAAQTPQAASLGLLISALDAAEARRSEPTDEAQALDAIGVPVRAVPGSGANWKLTQPGDAAILRAILRDRSLAQLEAPAADATPTGSRTGIGFDAHRLEEGRPLRLGGLAIAGERGLAGHSDGDVALHAVIDALLGAAALGDIGLLFPADDARWAGVDSGELLMMAVRRIGEAGLRPTGIDLVIVAARPAIAPVRQAMAERIADLVGIEPSSVSVKGTTSDGLGFAGKEGIAALAIATVARGA